MGTVTYAMVFPTVPLPPALAAGPPPAGPPLAQGQGMPAVRTSPTTLDNSTSTTAAAQFCTCGRKEGQFLRPRYVRIESNINHVWPELHG